MCGRFVQVIDFNSFVDFYKELADLNKEKLPEPNYNVSPEEKIGAVYYHGTAKLKTFVWGLKTDWNVKNRLALINIRKESLTEKRTFDKQFAENRCIIFANGFYEWKREGKKKTPYYILRKDEKPLLMAGLWDTWLNPASGEQVDSCAIITVPANELVGQIHDRMPAVISDEKMMDWLAPEAKRTEFLDLLKPYPADLMKLFRVSKQVNKGSNNFQDLIRPEEEEQGLF